MRINALFILLPLYLITLSSCVEEDLSDCIEQPCGVTLHYDFTLNMEYTNLFEKKVDQLKAFVFDDQGILCDTLRPAIVHGELHNGWKRNILLAPGQYTLVTWAGDGVFDNTFAIYHENTPSFPSAQGAIIGQTRLTDLRLFLKCNKESGSDEEWMLPLTSEFNDLYHGNVQQIVVKEKEQTLVTTSLIKNTNIIQLKINKLSALSKNNSLLSPADFDIKLTGENGHYLAHNRPGEASELIRYAPYAAKVADNSFSASMKTLRLMMPAKEEAYFGEPLKLSVVYKPTNVEICRDIDVVAYIMKGKIDARDAQGNILKDSEGNPIKRNPTLEYLDRQDFFEFVFEPTEDAHGRLEFVLYVNGWKIQNLIPETDR